MSGDEVETTLTDFYRSILMACTMTIPGLIANSLSFYCIIPDLINRKTFVKQLVFSLCCTDFIGCIGVLLFQTVANLNDIPVWICGCLSFVIVYCPILSGAITTFMAADRCAALRKPYWYQENMFSWRFWVPFACVVCIITLICLFPQMGLGNTVIYQTSGNVSVRICGPFREGMAKNIKESTFPVLYGSVGLVMVATNLSFNVAVLKTLHVMKKRVHPSARYRQDTSQEFEMTKMLLALSATFLICWLPLNLQLVLVQQGVPKYRVVDIIVHSLVSLNFIVDPVINLTVKRKYRVKMRRIFICKRRSETETNGPFRLTTLSTNTQDIMTARPE